MNFVFGLRRYCHKIGHRTPILRDMKRHVSMNMIFCFLDKRLTHTLSICQETEKRGNTCGRER